MKASKMEVLKEVIEITLSFESEGVAGVSYLAQKLNTTPYYVRKHVKTLIEEGYLVKGMRNGGWNEFTYTPYPPLKGYCITDKVKTTKMYSIVKKEVEEHFSNAFC